MTQGCNFLYSALENLYLSYPVIDQRLLLLLPGLKDINERDQLALFGNQHLFPPLGPALR